MMQLTMVSQGVAAVTGTMTAIVAVLPAEAQDFASEWGKLGAAAILGVICIVSMWTNYKSQLRNAASQDKLSEALTRLTERMAARPCLIEPGERR